MTQPTTKLPQDAGTGVSEEALERAEKYIEEEEGAANKLGGWHCPGTSSSASR